MQWKDSVRLPQNYGRTRLSLVNLNNQVYMFGGASSQYYHGDVYAFIPIDGKWIFIRKMKVKRESFALSVVNYYNFCKK